MIVEAKVALVGPGNKIQHVESDVNHLLAHCSHYAGYGVHADGKFDPGHYVSGCVVIVGTDAEIEEFLGRNK